MLSLIRKQAGLEIPPVTLGQVDLQNLAIGVFEPNFDLFLHWTWGPHSGEFVSLANEVFEPCFDVLLHWRWEPCSGEFVSLAIEVFEPYFDGVLHWMLGPQSEEFVPLKERVKEELTWEEYRAPQVSQLYSSKPPPECQTSFAGGLWRGVHW